MPLIHPLLSSSLAAILVQGSSYQGLGHHNSPLPPPSASGPHCPYPAVARRLRDQSMPYGHIIPHLNPPASPVTTYYMLACCHHPAPPRLNLPSSLVFGFWNPIFSHRGLLAASVMSHSLLGGQDCTCPSLLRDALPLSTPLSSGLKPGVTFSGHPAWIRGLLVLPQSPRPFTTLLAMSCPHLNTRRSSQPNCA